MRVMGSQNIPKVTHLPIYKINIITEIIKHKVLEIIQECSKGGFKRVNESFGILEYSKIYPTP